jgi:hypothetical protein
MDNKYQRGKIYKIVDNTNGNQYIGSTCEKTLAHRLAKHVGNYKCYLNGKNNYVSSYDILANSDYDIVLIENCPCQTKDELLARERHFKDNLICVNKNRPIISNVERNEYDKKYGTKYRTDHQEYFKQYRAEHQEHIKKHKNTKNECLICGSKYTTQNKALHIKSQRHQNAISLNGILSNHDVMMNNIEQIIIEINDFIDKAENFVNALNI